MELKDLERLLGEAARCSGETDFVIGGSLSALGIPGAGPIPPRMLMSIDVDCYTRRDPDRIFELSDSLGEGSEFRRRHRYFPDPVSPKLPTLPDDWERRLLEVPLSNGITAFFLDPDDAAVSKYARGEPRDREWIRAGLAAGLLSAPIIESRFRDTLFLDDEESAKARHLFAEDKAWLGRRRSSM